MASYSDYMLTASSSMMNIVRDAATSATSSAATAAGQVASSVSGVCHGVASSAQQKLLSYKYEDRQLSYEDKPDYPETDGPVWNDAWPAVQRQVRPARAQGVGHQQAMALLQEGVPCHRRVWPDQ